MMSKFFLQKLCFVILWVHVVVEGITTTTTSTSTSTTQASSSACPPFELPPNAVFDESTIADCGAPSVGSVCRIRCQYGWEIVGNAGSQCLPSGFWSNFGTCSKDSDGCDPDPCQGASTCQDRPAEEDDPALPPYTCVCNAGFYAGENAPIDGSGCGAPHIKTDAGNLEHHVGAGQDHVFVIGSERHPVSGIVSHLALHDDEVRDIKLDLDNVKNTYTTIADFESKTDMINDDVSGLTDRVDQLEGDLADLTKDFGDLEVDYTDLKTGLDERITNAVKIEESRAKNAETGLSDRLDLVYTKQETDNTFATQNALAQQRTDIEAWTSNNYYTKTQADNEYYKKSQVYTKNEANGAFYLRTVSDNRYYLKNDVDTKLAQERTTSNNLYPTKSSVYTISQLYTRSQVESLIQEAVRIKHETFFANSKILNSAQKTALGLEMSKYIRSMKQCYDYTKHARNAPTFHSLCDGFPNSVVIARATNNRVFGGFTSEPWSKSSQYRNSASAFLFRFQGNTLQRTDNAPMEPQYGIYAHNSYGPTWGRGHDWYVPYDLGVSSTCYNYGYSLYVNGQRTYSSGWLTGGVYQFRLNAIEVYYE